MSRKLRSFLVFLILLAPALAFAQKAGIDPEDFEERIRSFDSRVTINSDATVEVQETIQVTAAGEKIRHGIYRDFPTRYKDRFGNAYTVQFDIVSVERDGSSEPYHTEAQSNGIRIYFGSQNTIVSHGLHSYVFTYRVTRELGFFKDHDELYWNVTGTGWDFSIDRATAVVILPSAARDAVTGTDGYTGPQGATGKEFAVSRDPEGNPQFVAPRLGPHEGLTIVVTWPKGLIAEPTAQQKFAWFLHDNAGVIIGCAGFLIIFVYYLLAWIAVGRDPKAGPIMPLYEPPSGMSPAAIRYLKHMGFDQTALTANILDLGARGYLTIDCDKAGTYTLQRTRDFDAAERNLTPDEKTLARQLFSEDDRLVLKQEHHAVISAAEKALQLALHNAEEKVYFVTNGRYLWPGVVLTVATIIAALSAAGQAAQNTFVALFVTVWLAGWSLGVAALVSSVIKGWKAVIAGSWKGLPGVIFLTLFSLPFLAGECFGLFMLYMAASVGIFLTLVGSIALNVIFHRLLKAPTRAGRQLLDKIDGFKLFLGAVEGDQLKRLGAPLTPIKKTPQLFEKFLPYALALGVERAWAEQFAREMAAAADAGSQSGSAYSPSWYHGYGMGVFSAAAFTSSFSSSFSSAVASSSTAPGSSSGGGGGGSSGGGGGGGGGGGW
jgi:hypothetical protein